MSLKKLNQFLDFRNVFFDGKRFRVTGVSPLKKYGTELREGTKVEVVIVADKTVYQCKEGETVTNLYEKLVFKVMKDVEIPIGAEVRPVNPVAKVYGNYSENLSVVCEDIEIVGK